MADRSLHSLATPHLAWRARFKAKRRVPAGPVGPLRLMALGGLGLAVGVGGAVIGVSLVQASDRIDMYESVRFDEQVRQARRAQAPQVIYSSHASAYAPPARTQAQPLGLLNDRGQLVLPAFNLNPFNPTNPRANQPAPERRKARAPVEKALEESYDVVSGASNAPRSICVRLCDGYQHPIGQIRDNADLRGHEALCQAMFPGVPTRVFRVAAGAAGIDDAVSTDGRTTYRSLPMAYAYQTSIDPACARPRTGQNTVAVLRDFTLRPGDTVMMNGRPRVFNGATNYPFTSANFRDFRSSTHVNSATRQQIDYVVGVSRQERLQREVRNMARVREANADAGHRAIDVVRGGTRIEDASGRDVTNDRPSQPRVVEITRR